MREPAVMLTHSPRGWARDLHAYLMDHGGAVVRGYAVGSEDARAESYDVLVADDISSFLTPRVVDDIHRVGRRVLGVFDPEEADGSGKRRLVELGVDEVMATDAGATALLDAIVRVAGSLADDEASDVHELLEFVAADPTRRQRTSTTPLVTVAGAGGGVGATEVAIQLAVAMRRAGKRVALMDADDLGPSIAQRLGLPNSPNLRTVIDAHHQHEGVLDGSVHIDRRHGLEIVPGPADHRRWDELRPDDVRGVLDDLRRGGRHVVVNIAPHIEEPGVGARRGRFALAGSVAILSSALVVVGRPTPVGCRRIIDWCADARAIGAHAPCHVVVNEHQGSGRSGREISSMLQRTSSVRSVVVAPADERLRRAAWQGVVPTRGRFARAISVLAAAIEEATTP